MATYAIGDIHGCIRTLGALLERIGASSSSDRLWLVGDLINRGPGSLETLRWAVSQEHRVDAVLGNHDLNALAVAAGLRNSKPTDTLAPLLDAPDRDDLLDWLRRRPLLVRDDPWWLVHAGLLPAWTPERAESLAREAEAALAGADAEELLASVYEGPITVPWSERLETGERQRWTVRTTTRLRTCRPDSTPCESFTGPPEEAPAGCRPWYEQLGDSWEGQRIVFGHWAALGVRTAERAVGLDSGCVYGGQLTALRLDDGLFFQQPLVDQGA
jgi:bis(5'-nucleosyl)-tetraphosphatase (symmetrical)